MERFIEFRHLGKRPHRSGLYHPSTGHHLACNNHLSLCEEIQWILEPYLLRELIHAWSCNSAPWVFRAEAPPSGDWLNDCSDILGTTYWGCNVCLKLALLGGIKYENIMNKRWEPTAYQNERNSDGKVSQQYRIGSFLILLLSSISPVIFADRI